MAEAKARINQQTVAGSRLAILSENGQPANIVLESNTKITQQQLDKFGDNFEKLQTVLLTTCF